MQTRSTFHGSCQQGYTLVEILVALLIALFLLAGLGTMVAGTRRTSTNQTKLATLQDEQRLAMSVLNDVVQTAGYFDSNTYWTASSAFPSSLTTAGTTTATTLAAGQIIGGSHTAVTAPDSIIVRYSTTGTDGILSCVGTGGAAATYYNFFFISAANELQCSTDGTAANAVTLVSDVVNMQIWYGVSTVAGVNSADTYKTATQVAATDWPNVVSVRTTLTFNNPLYTEGTRTGMPGQSQYVYFTRVIALQARTGASLVAS